MGEARQKEMHDRDFPAPWSSSSSWKKVGEEIEAGSGAARLRTFVALALRRFSPGFSLGPEHGKFLLCLFFVLQPYPRWRVAAEWPTAPNRSIIVELASQAGRASLVSGPPLKDSQQHGRHKATWESSHQHRSTPSPPGRRQPSGARPALKSGVEKWPGRFQG